jgi:hypothetical protein
MADVPLLLGSRTVPEPQLQQISTDQLTTVLSYIPQTLDWISLRHSRWPSLHKLNWSELTVNSKWTPPKSKLYYDWRSVGQCVLVSGTYLGPATNFFPSIFNNFRQLWVCWCGAPSLTRSQVCSFQFLPFSDLSPTGLMSIFYCLYFRDSPNLEGQVPVFISPRNIPTSIILFQ